MRTFREMLGVTPATPMTRIEKAKHDLGRALHALRRPWFMAPFPERYEDATAAIEELVAAKLEERTGDAPSG